MTAVARDLRPPPLLIRLLNPVMRTVLRTPLSRVVGQFALLDFRGRRTGRRYLIPVGWHEGDSGPVVVTPAPWRVNFRGGHPVTVHVQGRKRRLTGSLDEDAWAVAQTLQALADRRGSLRMVGIAVPQGHRITPEDVHAVDRAVIRFKAAEDS